MLRALTPNRALLLAVGAPLAYWLVAFFVPTPILREIFNSLGFGVALIIVITWAPTAWHALREEASTAEWQLILAIFLTWAVILLQRLYAIVWNMNGRPVEWIEWPITAFWPFIFTVAGLLLLSAPGVRSDGFSVTALWAMLVAVFIGALAAGILIGSHISTVF